MISLISEWRTYFVFLKRHLRPWIPWSDFFIHIRMHILRMLLSRSEPMFGIGTVRSHFLDPGAGSALKRAISLAESKFNSATTLLMLIPQDSMEIRRCLNQWSKALSKWWMRTSLPEELISSMLATRLFTLGLYLEAAWFPLPPRSIGKLAWIHYLSLSWMLRMSSKLCRISISKQDKKFGN